MVLQDMRCGGMCTVWNITKMPRMGKARFPMPETGQTGKWRMHITGERSITTRPADGRLIPPITGSWTILLPSGRSTS